MTEAVMCFLGNEREPRFLVDVPRFYEHVVGPEHEFLVAAASSKANALFDEASAQTQAARLGFNQQKSEFGDRFTTLHYKYGADDFTAHFRDPAAFSCWIVVVDEISDDLGHECLEALVPAILLRVKDTVAVGDPAHIARLVRSQEKGFGKLEPFFENTFINYLVAFVK